MPGFPFDLVAIDIDGTMTIESGWKFLAERLGRASEYASTNAAYLSGTESEDEHLRRLLRLAEGVPIIRLEGLMEETPRLSGIAETVRTIQSLGASPVLLSHNPGYVSKWYIRRFGFEDWDGTAGRNEPEVIDGVVGGPGAIIADKPGGLKRLVERRQTSPSRVAHVGDAPPDARIFPMVGFGIALNASMPEVVAAADVTLKLSDLQGILGPLREARPRRVPENVL